MSLTTIARPYAKAVFDFAIEKGELAQWAEMLAFTAEIAQNATIQPLLDDAYSADKLAELFVAVGGEQLNKHGLNLLKVMAQNKRLAALPEVCEQFMTMRLELEQAVEVLVISAVTLSQAQQQAIAEKLSTRFGCEVKLNCSVDETLIAGVIIRAGDLVIDNSVSGRMRRLNDALQS